MGECKECSNATTDLEGGDEDGTTDEADCRMDDFEESCALDDGEGRCEGRCVVDRSKGVTVEEGLDALCEDHGPSCAARDVVGYQVAVFGRHEGSVLLTGMDDGCKSI